MNFNGMISSKNNVSKKFKPSRKKSYLEILTNNDDNTDDLKSSFKFERHLLETLHPIY